MMVRQIIALTIVVLLGGWLLGQIPRVHRAMQTNKAEFLANQSRWDEARRQLAQVLRRSPDYLRARRLLARVTVSRGDYAAALAILSELPSDADTDLERGVCAYQLDREDLARDCFAAAVAHGREPLAASRRMLALAGVQALTSDAGKELPAGDTDELEPVEHMVWHGLIGRCFFERRRFEEAREHLETALGLNDRNRGTVFLACSANAIAGDFPRARMYADVAQVGPCFFPELTDELRALADKTTTQSISVYGAAHAADTRFRLLRASVWAALQTAADSPWMASTQNMLDSTAELLDLSPDDTQAGLLRAEAFEALGRLPEAYKQYRATFARRPCYAVLVRVRDLAGDSGDIRRLEDELLDSPSIVARIPATAMVTTTGLLIRDHIAMYSKATAVAEFAIPAASEYYLNIVARGDQAFGLAPLLQLRIDGAAGGDIYVAREGWDCYSVRKSLGKGTHRLEMEYMNNSDRLLSDDEDRNVYIQELIISQGGAR